MTTLCASSESKYVEGDWGGDVSKFARLGGVDDFKSGSDEVNIESLGILRCMRWKVLPNASEVNELAELTSGKEWTILIGQIGSTYFQREAIDHVNWWKNRLHPGGVLALSTRDNSSLGGIADEWAFASDSWRNDWDRLRESIGRWSSLPNDWDGNDGVPPSKLTIFEAHRIYNILSQAQIVCPKGYVAGDGEVGFRWETEGGFASISILDDGCVLAYCRNKKDNTKFSQDCVAAKVNFFAFIESLRRIL